VTTIGVIHLIGEESVAMGDVTGLCLMKSTAAGNILRVELMKPTS